MPYNPTINDNSGQILAEAQMQANKIRALEQQQMWEGISNGVSSAASGLGDAFNKAADNKMTSDYLDGLAGQYSTTNSLLTKSPYMSAEELEKFSTMPLGKKSGIIAGLQAREANEMKQWMYQTQYNNYMGRTAAQINANQPAPNQQPYTGGNAAQQNNNSASNINFNHVK